VLTKDPSRPEGQASYSYHRVIFLGLSDSTRKWRERRGEEVIQVPHAPWLRLIRKEVADV
jgi:hypothetical protein